jgi:hypothetical protein
MECVRAIQQASQTRKLLVFVAAAKLSVSLQPMHGNKIVLENYGAGKVSIYFL